MGKFDGVLLASDFDNTLVDTAGAIRRGDMPRLSERSREALEYFIGNGGRFAVATGRALPGFIRFAPGVPMNAPAVICNGAGLYDFSTEEYLETMWLDDTVRDRIAEVLERFPKVGMEVYHASNTIYAVNINEFVRTHRRVTHVEFEELNGPENLPLPLGKVIIEDDRPVLEEVREWILARPWISDFEVFFSAQAILEMTAKGANKGNMVLRLADRLGIDRAHLYCAGDEANDLTMIRAAAEGFVPQGSPLEALGCGATVVSDRTRDPIADVVEILDRRYG